MARKTKDSARLETISELKTLQDELRETWLDRSLPEDWHGLESNTPINCAKERITIRLDEDMLKWFRAQGPGYQVRINRILRIYWNGIISGIVQSHYNEEALTPTFMEMVQRKARAAQEKRLMRD